MASPNMGRTEDKHAGMSDAMRGQGAGAATAERAKDMASNFADRAKDMAHSAADTASDFAHTAEQKADDAVASVGSGMQSLAGTIREKAPHEGIVGTASSRLASTLDSGGRYLKEEGLSGMADDLTNVIRRNPMPALFIGIGLGFLLARAMRR